MSHVQDQVQEVPGVRGVQGVQEVQDRCAAARRRGGDTRARLDHARFDYGRFDYARFDHARLDHARFEHARFEHGRFDHVHLTHARLDGARVERGMSVIELMIALALVSIVGGLCVASVSPEARLVQEEAAARFLVAQIRQARQEALQRSTNVGVRFEQDGDRIRFRLYADGNGNGLRTRDIQDRIDPPIGLSRRLEDDFAGASFGVACALPPIDTGGDRLNAGDDPIHVGSSRLVSFGPGGRGSSGTVYVRGRGGQQFAIRIFGQTGRVRLLQFRVADAQWVDR